VPTKISVYGYRRSEGTLSGHDPRFLHEFAPRGEAFSLFG